jgi:hypothetical protein
MVAPEAYLFVWAIFDHPRDYPDWWVVRAFEVVVGQQGSRASPVHTLHASLAEARASLPPGLVQLPLSKGDDPVIAETWV